MVLFAITSLFVLSAVVTGAADRIEVAPLNPDYLQYMADKQAEALSGTPLVKATSTGRTLGLIPSRIDFSFKREHQASRVKSQAGKLGRLDVPVVLQPAGPWLGQPGARPEQLRQLLGACGACLTRVLYHAQEDGSFRAVYHRYARFQLGSLRRRFARDGDSRCGKAGRHR